MQHGSTENRAPAPGFQGNVFAGLPLKQFQPLSLPNQAGDIPAVVNTLGPGSTGEIKQAITGRNEAPAWPAPFLRIVRADLLTLLHAYPEQRKAAAREFKRIYANILSIKDVDRQRSLVEVLCLQLEERIRNIEARAGVTGPTPEVVSVAPWVPESPEMGRLRAQYAYAIIKHAAEIACAGNAGRHGSTIIDTDESLAQARSSAPASGAEAARNSGSGKDAVSAYRTAERALEGALHAWLRERHIRAIPNSGTGNNCLIYAMLQHATGNYGNRAPDGANTIRTKAGIEAQEMLYSDGPEAIKAMEKVNETCKTSINLFEVVPVHPGRPLIATAGTKTGDEEMAVLRIGDHFEALVYDGDASMLASQDRDADCASPGSSRTPAVPIPVIIVSPPTP